MGLHSSYRASAALLLLLCFCITLFGVHGESPRLYIVYLGDVKHGHPDDVVASHHDLLGTVIGSKEHSLASITHNYKHGFSGFAAMLTEDQAEQLAEFPEVISIELSRMCTATTTRSWDFLGLNYQMPGELLRKSNQGEDIIIGVVDSGIWPESRSFSDQGYGPVPSRWKGKCQVGEGWNRSNCSRKIIGARFYGAGMDDILKTEYLSARDYDGHGTHTASTAAGSVVEAASFHGLAAGVARGGAPRARIAVYKTLWVRSDGSTSASSEADVLAAIDDAIHDGVDVLSLSLGSLLSQSSYAALHAVQRGITVVFAGGNSGPDPQTVENTSPWVITVAASTIDRSFPTVITLGNKQQITGQSLYYHGKNSSRSIFRNLALGGICSADTLNRTDVTGKIVLCFPLETVEFKTALQNIRSAGGSGLIYTTNNRLGVTTTADCEGIACVLVDLDTGYQIVEYAAAAASSAVAKIEPARSFTSKELLAPKVASFSSRGPPIHYDDIIKPDIAAPGDNILAAQGDSYAIQSGTSMAAPHVAGIIALLKALHPDWSPAALKSAIITTASVTDEHGMPILAEGLPRKIADPFDYGGGNINPNMAADPGLIYDIDPSDYNKFFGCTINRASATCNETSVPGYHMNLPSISISDLRHPITVSRTITNVGEVDAVYNAAIESPLGVKMDVEPSVLVFNATNKVQTFRVKLSPMWKLQGDYTFGSLTWYNGKKTVRIPIAARMTIYDCYADIA